MKDYGRIVLIIAVAFIVHLFLGKISHKIFFAFNLFTILVIYSAILRGEIFGAVSGAICGLIQDSFSLGAFGVSGIATTLMGYLAGMISRRFLITSFFKNFLFIFLLTAFQLMVWKFIYTFVFGEPFFSGSNILFVQPFFNALVGSSLFRIFRKFFKSFSLEVQ